ncbi:hypothetical protein SASPL_118004 [Salvia splendens]|uniref:Shikimate O-hydroxycinnamoyltransferase n=1 Tax=Salvia splendens TaxID=180675 RepID=A0A8X8ZYR0_SALSN|nr:hypothetical protein SASPL_118004 [Salvia splendens]
MMKMKVKETTVVKPAPAKPRSTIWISNLGAILPENYHTRTHIFYRPTAVPDFFDAAVLKAALARTLSEFYPMAGRLHRDAKGRIEIDCNGEGATFIEAEAEADLDDLGDFAPTPISASPPKCICKAHRLPKDQETKLTIIVDRWSRLRPPLPLGYFGNAVFKASHIALSGEVESKPLNFTIGKIREAMARMDDEYLRSAIDYLEVEGSLHPNARGTGLYKSPNLSITSWARLPFYDIDFG